VTMNGPLGGGAVLTIQGKHFGVSSIGWDFAYCMRYRDPENPDISQCISGESVFVGIGRTKHLEAVWTSDTQILGKLPGGARSGHDLTVNISKQESWLTLAFSYDKVSFAIELGLFCHRIRSLLP